MPSLLPQRCSRAVQYLRASTGLQSYSILFQTEALAAYAANHGHEIIRTYSDEARSGLDLRGRPALQQLIADCLDPQRDFDTLLVFDVSRWGRFQDLDEAAHYEFICRRAGVRLIYCAEPFENDGAPDADLIKQVKRAIAAEYSRGLSDRVANAKRFVALKGFWTGGPAPYGLRRLAVDLGGAPIQILELGQHKVTSAYRTVLTRGPLEEVEAIQALFRLYVVTGLKPGPIARQLEEERRRPPTPNGWTHTFVRKALRQPLYAGQMVWGRRRVRMKGRIEPTAESTWVTRGLSCDPIISEERYAAAQLLLSRNHRTDERLLADLMDVWRLNGSVTRATLRATPGVASYRCYADRFGSLRNACALIGYRRPPPPLGAPDA